MTAAATVATATTFTTATSGSGSSNRLKRALAAKKRLKMALNGSKLELVVVICLMVITKTS